MTTYVITLTKSLTGSRVIAWRKLHNRTKYGVDMMPWKLIEFLRLIPTGGEWTTFTNKLYNFTNEDLENLQGGDNIKSITKRRGRYIITIKL